MQSTGTYDVIIIGAGAAGLACAERLVQAGKSIVVLEAQDRVGGRIHTIRERGVAEAGAEFIHGEHAITWDYVRENAIATDEWKPSKEDVEFEIVYGANGGIQLDDSKILAEINSTREAAYSYHGEDTDLATFLSGQPISGEVRNRIKSTLAILEATDSEKLSVRGITIAEELATNGNQNFFIPEGYDQVVTALANELDIKLSNEVTHITWSRGHVSVACKNGSTYRASSCVITLSLGVMKENPPVIIPNLKDTFWNAIHRIGFGNNSKPILWITGDVPEFQILSTKSGLNFWQRKCGDETMIVGYSGGSTATRLTAMTEAEAINEAIVVLEEALGSGIRERVAYARHFTWSDNPFVRGSYSYPTVGMGEARTELGEPIEDTIYYSGEAIHDKGHAATVHGAIEAGRMTAERILASI